MSFAKEMQDALSGFKTGTSIVNDAKKNKLATDTTTAETGLKTAQANYFNKFAGSIPSSGQAPTDGATVAAQNARTQYDASSSAIPATPVNNAPTSVVPPPKPVTASAIPPVTPAPAIPAPAPVSNDPDTSSSAQAGYYANGGMVVTPNDPDDPDYTGPDETDQLLAQGPGMDPNAAAVYQPGLPRMAAAAPRMRPQKNTALPVPDANTPATGQPGQVVHGSIPDTFDQGAAPTPASAQGNAPIPYKWDPSKQDMPETVLGGALHGALSFIQKAFGMNPDQQSVPAYDPRMGNDIYYADGTPYPLDPNTGQPIKGAVEGQPTPQGGAQGAIPTQQKDPNHAVKLIASYSGAMSNDEFNQVRKIVDPQGQLDDQLGNVAAINGMYNFYMSKGDTEHANQAAASMVMTLGKISSQLGGQAQAAIRSGDYPKAGALLKKAYDYIPDGNSAQAQVNPDGTGQVLIKDANGNVIHHDAFTPQQLYDAATGMKNGKTFWNQMIYGAATYTKQKPETMPGYEPPPPDPNYTAAANALGVSPDGSPLPSTQPVTPVTAGSSPSEPAASAPAPQAAPQTAPPQAPAPQADPNTPIPVAAPSTPQTAPVAAPTPTGPVGTTPATPQVPPGNTPIQASAIPTPGGAAAAPQPSATAQPAGPDPFAIAPGETDADGNLLPAQPKLQQYPLKGPNDVPNYGQLQRPVQKAVDDMLVKLNAPLRTANDALKADYTNALKAWNAVRTHAIWKMSPMTPDERTTQTTAIQTAVPDVVMNSQLPNPLTGKPFASPDEVQTVLGDASHTVTNIAIGLMQANPGAPRLQDPAQAAQVALMLSVNPQDPSKPNIKAAHMLPTGNAVSILTDETPPRKYVVPIDTYRDIMLANKTIGARFVVAQQQAKASADAHVSSVNEMKKGVSDILGAGGPPKPVGGPHPMGPRGIGQPTVQPETPILSNSPAKPVGGPHPMGPRGIGQPSVQPKTAIPTGPLPGNPPVGNPQDYGIDPYFQMP